MSEQRGRTLLKAFLLLLFLYIFLVSIGLLEGSFRMMGKGFAEGLLRTTANPFIGLLIGILATSVIQSSSATTSIVVGMVAAGTLDLPSAVPIVMGANIGTSVTNTIVSMGHITRPTEFRRAFAGATVHDFFNILSVAVFLPLECLTHFLEYGAVFLTKIFGGMGGFTFASPLKAAVKPAAYIVEHSIVAITHGGMFGAIVELIIALIFLFGALKFLVSLMRTLVLGKIERLLHGYLFVTPIRSMLLGLLFTVIVQSSSVVTSLIIPLVGAGILSIEQVFPYTLGANVGTTVTAILASLVTGNPAAISTAFVHTLFNISGILVWYPLRRVPIMAAKWLGGLAFRRRWLAIVYVLIMFFGLPVALIFLFKGG